MLHFSFKPLSTMDVFVSLTFAYSGHIMQVRIPFKVTDPETDAVTEEFLHWAQVTV